MATLPSGVQSTIWEPEWVNLTIAIGARVPLASALPKESSGPKVS